jgi:hypothetical protein
MSVLKIPSKKIKNFVVLTIDTDRKRIDYRVLPETSQRKHFDHIDIVGFSKLPSGFYRDGYGVARPAGSFVLQHLARNIGEHFGLTITASGRSRITTIGGQKIVIFNYDDFSELQRNLRSIRSESNIQSKQYVTTKLAGLFPKLRATKKQAGAGIAAYQQDRLAKLVHSESDFAEKLSKNDITAVAELYAELLEKKRFGQTVGELRVLGKSRGKTEKVLLEKVITDFEARLKKVTLSENDWQQFFEKFIVLFNTSYVHVLEKLSVSLGGKYPDFILLNVYNYLDIYEIKRPHANLLKLDTSRGNFYWDAEVSKAIAQTENYIDLINKNAHAFVAEVRQRKNLDIKVVRPRGYIIVGNREQLTTEKMQDDFRLLASASKNVDVIPYDDLLNNLKNLAKRL